ncbi:hypothetical protein L2D08_14225 [Domibacillus sp. PGB-M46]|uniref:hypothetical protein n=1 Tax=Domibacillus sp. PGB-M46 TaxID=2910255 RepID=UPI001F5769B3|nr:hypothetical protein [Domibacillus sp. PGB-M46]MCI2255527.1 hypothetical protein [Domibacillus sp. PGB-M46]
MTMIRKLIKELVIHPSEELVTKVDGYLPLFHGLKMNKEKFKGIIDLPIHSYIKPCYIVLVRVEGRKITQVSEGCRTGLLRFVISTTSNRGNYKVIIIGNSISQLILPLKEKDIADLKNHEILKLSEEKELIISKFLQGEGIYIVGNNRIHMSVDHRPEEMRLIHPEKYEKTYGQKAAL